MMPERLRQGKSGTVFISLIFLLSFFPIEVTAITRSQQGFDKTLRRFSQIQPLMLTKNYKKVKAKLTGSNNPEEYFLLGHIATLEKDKLSAYRHFSMAAQSNPRFFTVRSFQDAADYVSKQALKNKSYLFNDSIVALVQLGKKPETAVTCLQLLNLINSPGPLLSEKILFLETKLLLLQNPYVAYPAATKLVKKYPESLTYQLLLAEVYKATENQDAANRTLEKLLLSSNSFYYSKQAATMFVRKNLNANKILKSSISEQKKLIYAESFRLKKRYGESASIFKSIRSKSLSKEDLSFYISKYSLLLAQLKRHSSLTTFIDKIKPEVTDTELHKALDETGNYLIKKNQYNTVIKLFPPRPKSKRAIINILKSYLKKGHNQRVTAAKYYLTEFDPHSQLAARTWFSKCLELILAKKKGPAQRCLEESLEYTKRSEDGGMPRFHLAKIYESNGQIDKARTLYRDVYLNFPDNYYVKAALNRTMPLSLSKPPGYGSSLAQIRNWLSVHASSKKSLNDFFKLKSADKSYAVHPFWVEWELKLSRLNQDMTDTEKKASLFLAMGLSSLGANYLKNSDEEKKTLIYQNVGEKINDARYKYWFLRKYIKQSDFFVDVFLLSKKAKDFLYPTPFQSIVKEVSTKYGVEQGRIYALMKQESSFNPIATSYVGAKGLMQVMPKTAKWLNKRLKIPNLNLYNPKHSLILGTKFYSDMIRTHGRNFEKIAVAYNAGPGRLRRWKKELSPDLDIFVEQIPFKETYKYVKITKAEYDRYTWLLLHK